MALPNVFTSGDVFTAANANLLRSNQYNQTVSTKTANYVLVAADVGTRVLMNAAGTTTITVNTSLFAAGDTLEIANIGAGVCTITSGTCTVTSSSSLALVQYASGTLFFTSTSAAIFIASAVTTTAGGLVPLVSTTTVTAASTITATPFSATYDNYLILMTMQTSTASAINFQLTASGTPATTNYNRQHIEASGATVSGARSTGESSYFWSNATTTANAYSVQIINPFKASRTEFVGQGNTGSATALGILNIVANNSNATSYDGFKIFFDSTYTGTGTYTVYGYGKTA